jgi:hypothetical protein
MPPLQTSPHPDNIVIGAPASISVSDYVASRGAGTFVVLGYSIGGVVISDKRERTPLYPDQLLGKVRSVPHKADAQIKFKMFEATLENLRYALALPPGAKTGTTPNFTLKRNMSEAERYHQIKVVGIGNGTTGVRTFTAWRCVFLDTEDLEIKKDGAKVVGVTIDICEESDTPANGAYQYVDA